jgi:hypothetical protein
LNFVIAISADIFAKLADAWSVLKVSSPVLRPTATAPDGLRADLHELYPVKKRCFVIVALDDRPSAAAATFDGDAASHPPTPD